MANNKDKGTGDLTDTVAAIKRQLDNIETVDGADADVSVPDGEGLQTTRGVSEVEDAVIVEDDEPHGPEDECEEDELPPKVEEKTSTSVNKDDLVSKGVLPPTGKPKRRPIADAVQHENSQGAQPLQQQVDPDYQEQIKAQHSQQGSIALELIKSMLSNGNVSAKTPPKALVKRAYDITDELQRTLDKRHKDALLEAFAQANGASGV